jgi:hypothetical protein
MIKMVQPMAMPSYVSLGDEICGALVRMDERFRDVHAPSLPGILAWLASDPANQLQYAPFFIKDELVHELSPYLSALNDVHYRPPRSCDEIAVLDQMSGVDPAGIAASEFSAFKQLLLSVAGSAGGIDRFRDGEVGTAADKAGSRVVYPPARIVESQLEILFDFFRAAFPVSPSFCAIVLYAGIANLHPFADSNGRVSRILYNWIVRAGAGSLHYIPLFEVGMLSCGGMLIRLRHATYYGNWAPLILFFDHIVGSVLQPRSYAAMADCAVGRPIRCDH